MKKSLILLFIFSFSLFANHSPQKELTYEQSIIREALVLSSCHFLLGQSIRDLLNQLSYLNHKLTLSNYSSEERNNNLRLCDAAYALIKLLFVDMNQHPDQLHEYLHLAYKLANCFQQNDRAVDGEITLKIALQVLKNHCPTLDSYSAADICEILKETHPLLPSMYAALCHYMAKSYFKQPYSSLIRERELDASEIFLKRSLELRAIIDAYPDLYEEPLDSGRSLHYSSHTILFSRTIGYFHLEKGDFLSAKTLYEEMFQRIENLFEKVMACQQLVNIYCQLARQEWDREKAQDYYFKAYSKVKFLEEYLKHENWSGSSTTLRILAEFYADQANPFYDLLKAKTLLEKPIINNESISHERLAATSKNLGKLYQQLSQELMQRSSQIDDDLQTTYFAGKTSSLLNSIPSTRVQGLVALAQIYRKQKQFLQAGLLLSNAISISDQLNEELNKELWHQLYLVENEYFETIQDIFKRSENGVSYPIYIASIQRYKNALQEARKQFKQNLSLKNCWNTHEKLANDIQHIIESMFREILSLLKPIQIPFAVVGLGSLSREIMSPYSDVEYLIVYSHLADAKDQEYITALSTLFLLRLISLGETPSKQFKWNAPSTIDMNGLEAYEGMRPDVGGLISHSFGGSYKMRGTIQELMTFSSQLVLPMAFIKGKLLFGSETLSEDFEKQVNKTLSESSQDQKKSLLCYDLMTHLVPIIHINTKGQRSFSPKHSFLRAMTLILSHLAIYYEIFEQNPAKILSCLEKKGIISVVDKEYIDLFLRNLLYLISTHYQENSKQLIEIVIADKQQLESFLDLTQNFYKSLMILVNALPFPIVKSWDLTKMRLRALYRGNYLDLVEKELAIRAESTQNKDQQWEIRGDLEMVNGRFSSAYASYMHAFEENPKDVFLHFKLSEASLLNDEMDKASKHLHQIETWLKDKENPFLQLKISYFKCLMARKQNDWIKVREILACIDTPKNYPILKPHTLLYGLIEIEKAQLHIHFKNSDKACQHLEVAKNLIANRYGSLHPLALPVYELLHIHLSLDKWEEKKLYQDYIFHINTLFPNVKWQGMLDAHLLD